VPARSTILIIGDDIARGTRPVSELTAINAGYAAAQADCQIWNEQVQAWQATTPGTNTDTVTAGSDRWSLEARLREGLRSKIPTGTVYVVKHAVAGSSLQFADLRRAVDGTSAGGALYPCWLPSARDTTGYSGALAQMKAAAAAANLAGDTLVVAGIVISAFVDDLFLPQGWRSYADRMLELVEALRTDIATLPYCSLGSLRGDAGKTPVVLIEPHAEFSGLSSTQKARLLAMRSEIRELIDEEQRIYTFPTQSLTCVSGGKYLDAASMVALGEQLPARFYVPTGTSDAAFPEAPLAIIVGDSIFDGTGIPPWPSRYSSPLTNVNYYNYRTCQFETVQAGVNNLSNVNLLDMGCVFGEMMRDALGEVWVVKGTMPSSYCVANRSSMPVAMEPLQDVWRKDWDPATRRGLYDLTFRSSLVEAVRQLRASGKKPVVRSVSIFLGTNDAGVPSNPVFPSEPRMVVPSLKRLIHFMRLQFNDLGIDPGATVITVGMPAESPAGVSDTVRASISKIRSDMQAWELEDNTIRVHDASGYETIDGIHWSTNGTIAFAQDHYTKWKQEVDATVQPLFVPTKLQLKKALRLSAVSTKSDSLAQIDAAIQTARTRIYQTLSASVISQILEIPYTVNPSTDEEYLRMVSSDVEVKMVRLELLRVMPVLFKDNATTVQTWQEDGAFRDGSYLQVRDEIRRLEQDIQTSLEFLQTSGAAVLNTQAEAVAPDERNYPGDSIFETF
jgi:hypothetical protein